MRPCQSESSPILPSGNSLGATSNGMGCNQWPSYSTFREGPGSSSLRCTRGPDQRWEDPRTALCRKVRIQDRWSAAGVAYRSSARPFRQCRSRAALLHKARGELEADRMRSCMVEITTRGRRDAASKRPFLRHGLAVSSCFHGFVILVSDRGEAVWSIQPPISQAHRLPASSRLSDPSPPVV